MIVLQRGRNELAPRRRELGRSRCGPRAELGLGLERVAVRLRAAVGEEARAELRRRELEALVRGWNLDTMEEIVGTASASDLGGGSGGSGPGNAASTRQDVVILSDVRSQEEANALALAQLRNRAESYITARGEVIGMPELRPGDTMQIDGLGSRFSGAYFVTGVEHELGGEGYRTRFDARRTREGSAA